MGTPVSHVTRYPCSLASLYGVLTDPAYWSDRVVTMGDGGGEVLSCSAFPGQDASTGDPVFTAVVRQVVPTTAIPSALTRFAPSIVTVISTESWGAAGADEAVGSFSSTVQSVPASVDASVVLRAVTSDTCDMHFDGTITAGLPVVGAAIEKMMLSQTAAGFDIERDHVLGWLARQTV